MRKSGQLIVLIAFSLLYITLPATAQKRWVPADTPAISDGLSAYPTMAVDGNNVKYIAFLDGTRNGSTTVMKYDSTHWQVVGNAGFSGRVQNNVVMVIDNFDTPYVVLQSPKASVMKYNGTNWVQVGTAGFSAGQAMDISMVFDGNNTPYVAYRDVSTGMTAHVMKYDGSNWVQVGAAGFSGGNINVISIAIGKNDTPYVAYSGLASNMKVDIVKYNGASWVPVPNTGITTGSGNTVSLICDSKDSLYLAANDGSLGHTGSVFKFDGTQWRTIGGSGFPFAIDAFDVDSDGIPYVGYQDNTYNGRGTVLKYDGTAWDTLGNPGFSLGGMFYMHLLLDNNNMPYVAYTDRAINDEVTVMKYDCPQKPKPEICGVLTDTTTGNNIIVWDGSTLYADSYKIYRENSGNYTYLGSAKASTGRFADLTANPAAQSYKYKLTILDSCGRETIIDSTKPHKTVRLVFNGYTAQTASMTWNSYPEIPNIGYVVKRSNNGSPFYTIDSFGIAGVDTTYIDLNPVIGNNIYRIDMPLANPCTAGSITYKKLTSNAVASQYVGIAGVGKQATVSLMPNPAYDKLNIIFTQEIMQVEVFDMLGKKLIAEKGNSKKEAVLNISELAPGMYVMRINSVYNTQFVKR